MQVATVLTVYGIETITLIIYSYSIKLQQYLPFTVLKPIISQLTAQILNVLQQYLPFTVLKPSIALAVFGAVMELQQYLPFTVLKQHYD